MKRILLPLFLIALTVSAADRRLIDSDWRFAFGHTDPALDFGAGTEYFNYLTKANSIHNAGPYAPAFNDSAWVTVDLPFDFVVDLPFAREASHSHGYKTVGYLYPTTSVGWYRKNITIPSDSTPQRVYLTFDGIFRDSRVWFNGFYLGGEPSGYTQQRYDVTPYVNWDGDNTIAVRADATLEEGWFYEGGGIYRHVWLETAPLRHILPNSVAVTYTLPESDGRSPLINVAGQALNHIPVSEAVDPAKVTVSLIDSKGQTVTSASTSIPASALRPGAPAAWEVALEPSQVTLWDVDNPVLYTVRVELEGAPSDVVDVTTGFRTVAFDSEHGFMLNGKPLKLKGVNMHQDHAGVGAGIPDAVNIYRLRELKKYGVNAYRASHNPMTPEVLAACDSLGILVIEENRLLGINDYHLGQLRKMIDRDRNHPSIILWSVGNEEWGVEWDKKGELIVSELRDIAHAMDPSRQMTVATSGGPTVVIPADVAGYNYILQNPVEKHRADYPDRSAYGSEETSGCGTRGVYFDDRENGRMASLNRKPDQKDSVLNRIERGWKFYAERPWLGGLFYWTGFDYRGEPNPLEFPATGSEFGILDYCGFPKDEAYYLRSWWTDEPTLHILPHWNLEGHEGETIPVWVYSNMDEVELIVNGKSLGRKPMPRNGHLEWDAVYKPGKVEARGYRNGRRVLTSVVETAGQAVKAVPEVAYTHPDGVSVINISLVDRKGRFAPTACDEVTVTLPEGVTLLGAGNGDPAFRIAERPVPGSAPGSFTLPAFNGHAQFIVSNPLDLPLDFSIAR